jgi:endo-1,4-beta-D-glucanase Y
MGFNPSIHPLRDALCRSWPRTGFYPQPQQSTPPLIRIHEMGLRTPRPGKRPTLIALLLILSISAGCKQGSWTLWDSYSARFIDAQGRVIDRSAGDRTTSEGQAYAMFFALVDNDRITFERVLTWTQANLADGDLQTHLPIRLWGFGGNEEWGALDPNSASDADVWMAYSLVEAGRLWKVPFYSNLGRKMMDQIAKSEVIDLPGFGPLLMPGPTGFQHDQAFTLNPSYMPLFIFERLAQVDPAGPWRQIALNIPRFLAQSSRHGFAMDWVDYLPGDGFYPAAVKPANAPAQPPQQAVPSASPQAAAAPSTIVAAGAAQPMLSGGSYDAIRVYLWAGMLDGKGQTRAQILSALPAMSVYLANHDAPPQMVSDQGIPMAQGGPIGFSAAVLPYLRAIPGLSPESAKQTVRMARQRNQSTGLFGKETAYYDQNLALFATGYLDGKFRFGASGELNVEWTRQ